jgi:pyrimidine operon attenuation protein / uracil phosphoribosyltransferase
MDHAAIDAVFDRLSAQLSEQFASQPDAPLLVGVHRGGVLVAQALHHRLGLSTPLGTLDIAFYRDDVSSRRLNPQVQPSQLPLSVDGRCVVLVDDVLHTGRTVRAALNELFDFGRPARVMLVVLVDRGGRELPVQPDLTGTCVSLAPDQQIRLEQDDDGLRLRVRSPPQPGNTA